MVTTYLYRTDRADRARGYHSIFVRFSHSIGRPPSVEPVSDSPWRADWTFQRRRATLMPASFLGIVPCTSRTSALRNVRSHRSQVELVVKGGRRQWGTSRGERSNATQRRGNRSRPQYPRCYPRPSKHAQQPIRLHAGRSRVGPSPSNRHSPHSPHTPPLAHRTARTRKPRAKGARSLVRRVPQKKFLP